VAVRRFDDELALSVLERSFAVLPAGDVADLVVGPVLRRLGEHWHEGPRMIAVEHFTSQAVRARFQAHSADGSAVGPLAVCFTPAGDQHDLGVHLAAAALVGAGWRTRILGADTPLASADAAIEALHPQLVVVGACLRQAAEDYLGAGLAHGGPVLVGGQGFEEADRGSAGVVVHTGPFAEVPAVAGRLVAHAGAP
jgi:hypothetical protein